MKNGMKEPGSNFFKMNKIKLYHENKRKDDNLLYKATVRLDKSKLVVKKHCYSFT